MMKVMVVLAIFDGIRQIWAVLWCQRGNVTILCELFHDILYHSKVDIAFHIVPF